jgi:hypothetical protein
MAMRFRLPWKSRNELERGRASASRLAVLAASEFKDNLNRRANWYFPTKGRHMQITSFKDLYITELQELTSLEGQLVHALRRMANAASHPSLKSALKHHREQTATRIDTPEAWRQLARPHGSGHAGADT